MGSGASSGMGGVSSSANGGQTGGASDPGSSGASSMQPRGGAPTKRGSCSSVASPPGTAREDASAWWPLALLLVAARRRATRRAGDALLVALLPLAASGLSGCSDDATRDPGSSSADDGVQLDDERDRPPVDCGGAAEDFVLGKSKATPYGVLTVAIVAAEPAPPRVGSNAWTVLLSDVSGVAMTGADVTFTGWMPEHGHGLSSVPLARELDGGRYEIRPINLFMPQLWEFGVAVTHEEQRDIVRFSFCVR
jgi:hypothetical protein